MNAGEAICQPFVKKLRVHDLVAYQATIAPDNLALASESESANYIELDRKSNQLAHYLRELGVGPETLVALCLDRSVATGVAALGILKAGGAFLPIDRSCPDERIAYMLNDAQPRVVIAQAGSAERIAPFSSRLVTIGPCNSQVADQPTEPVVDVGGMDNLAYVMYTSGSTGRPKGVQISHGSLLNLIFWYRQAFALTSSDRVTQIASLGFDAAVWEIWPCLSAGASVHFVPDSVRIDPQRLRDWLVCKDISISLVLRPLAERILDLEWPTDTCLRMLQTGGDVLHKYPRTGLPFVLVNSYGPTECTVASTSGVVLPSESAHGLPSIGRPIANTKIYILDNHLDPVPAGSPGELYIGGPQLARGYLNRPDLTAEKFLPDPFSDDPGSRLYETGDMARLLPDGQIAFLGRSDDQVKIRGCRVEVNEIVRTLDEHPAIRESAVIARDDCGETSLIAYVVPTTLKLPSPGELREFLRRHLPDYMLPKVFVRLEALPIGATGKVDVRSLPGPASFPVGSRPPSTPVETALCHIFSVALGVAGVGVTDNFFDLGGHSLTAALIVRQIRAEFHSGLLLSDFYERPTVEQIALLLSDPVPEIRTSKPIGCAWRAGDITRKMFQQCYALTEPDLEELLCGFPNSSPVENDLLIGRRFEWQPDLICGGPCIANDTGGFSMNTFYQILVPLRLARAYNCPAAIYVAVMEETLRHPEAQRQFSRLGLLLERAIHRIAAHCGVEVLILNTATGMVNAVIESVRKTSGMRLTPRQSDGMYSLHRSGCCSTDQHAQPDQTSIHINERFVVCHTAKALAQLTACHRVLIVEDAEQKDVVAVASLFDNPETVDFLPFLPCPDLSGRGPMFRASPGDYLLLSSLPTEMFNRVAAAPVAIRRFYESVALLLPPGNPPTIQTFLEYAATVMQPRSRARTS